MKYMLSSVIAISIFLASTACSASTVPETKLPPDTEQPNTPSPETTTTITEATWSQEQRDVFEAALAGDFIHVKTLHAAHPNLLKTRFSGTFAAIPESTTWQLNNDTLLHVIARTPADQAHEIDQAALTAWLVGNNHLDVNVLNGNDLPALHIATRSGNMAIARVLLTHNANLRGPNGMSPRQYALEAPKMAQIVAPSVPPTPQPALPTSESIIIRLWKCIKSSSPTPTEISPDHTQNARRSDPSGA